MAPDSAQNARDGTVLHIGSDSGTQKWIRKKL